LATDSNAGHDGWPTIRYYNHRTGLAGGDYVRKTNDQVCDELGDNENFISYVETMGKTTMCKLNLEGCDDTEITFLQAMQRSGTTVQKRILASLKEEEMNAVANRVDEALQNDLLRWLGQRRKLLKLLLEDAGELEKAETTAGAAATTTTPPLGRADEL